MKQILISGISGFLGARLAERLHKNYQLSGLVHEADSALDCELLRLDLADTGLIQDRLEALKPDLILHTAAVSRPLAFAENPEYCWRVNVAATRELAAWCRKRDRRLFFCSSDTVYADAAPGAPAWRESDPMQPVHAYGRSKQEAEELLRELCPEAVILRLSLLFGRTRPGRNSFSEWLLARYHEGRVPVFSDNRRHTIAVGEVATLFEHLLEEESFHGVLNVGSADYVSREDFARLLFAQLELNPRLLAPSTTAAANLAVPLPLELPLDLQRLREILGNLPAVSDGIAQEYTHAGA